MPTVTCPYKPCPWQFKAWLERTAELAREGHLAVCPSSPRKAPPAAQTPPSRLNKERPLTSPLDPELTGSYFLCSFMQYGCSWVARWLPGDEAQARAARDQHEQGCIFRFHQPRP